MIDDNHIQYNLGAIIINNDIKFKNLTVNLIRKYDTFRFRTNLIQLGWLKNYTNSFLIYNTKTGYWSAINHN